MWEAIEIRCQQVESSRSYACDNLDKNFYNANNFVGAPHRIKPFHNEYSEAARPPVTGETTDLAGGLPEGRRDMQVGSDAGG